MEKHDISPASAASIGARAAGHGRRWWLALILPLLLASSFAVQWPYFSSELIEDDYQHLAQLGAIAAGHQSIADYVLALHNEHWIPLWKLGYYLHWRLFGIESFAWHVSITFAHGLSAVLLLVLLLHYLESRFAASIGALLWSLTAVGGWENPLIFIGASHLTFGLLFLLGAMACVTRFANGRALLWAGMMAASLSASVLMMGSLWVLTPALLLQLLWLEWRREMGRSRLLLWLAAWLVPFLALGAVQVPLLLGSQLEDAAGKRVDLPETLLRSGASFTYALQDLFYRMTMDGRGAPSRGTIFVGSILWCLLLYLLERQRRFLLWVTAIGGVYVLLVQAARVHLPMDTVLMSGRYLYVPTWMWCVGIAAGLSDPVFAEKKDRVTRAIVVVVCMGVAWSFIHQREVARRTTREFAELSADRSARFRDQMALFQMLSARASEEGTPVVLPNYPLLVPPEIAGAWTFYRGAFSRRLPDMRFTGTLDASDEEVETVVALLRSIDHADAERWIETMRASRDRASILNRLADWKTPAGKDLRFPDVRILVHDIPLRARHFVRITRADGISRLNFVPSKEMSEADWAILQDAIEQLDDQSATRWLRELQVAADVDDSAPR